MSDATAGDDEMSCRGFASGAASGSDTVEDGSDDGGEEAASCRGVPLAESASALRAASAANVAAACSCRGSWTV